MANPCGSVNEKEKITGEENFRVEDEKKTRKPKTNECC